MIEMIEIKQIQIFIRLRSDMMEGIEVVHLHIYTHERSQRRCRFYERKIVQCPFMTNF